MISGTYLSGEISSKLSGSELPPDDLGKEGTKQLLEEVFRGGCVDSTSQSLVLLMMALGPRDVSKVVTGPLSNYTIAFLRHLKDVFNVTFKLENVVNEDDLKLGADKVKLTCVGIGFTNLSKRTT